MGVSTSRWRIIGETSGDVRPACGRASNGTSRTHDCLLRGGQRTRVRTAKSTTPTTQTSPSSSMTLRTARRGLRPASSTRSSPGRWKSGWMTGSLALEGRPRRGAAASFNAFAACEMQSAPEFKLAAREALTESADRPVRPFDAGSYAHLLKPIDGMCTTRDATSRSRGRLRYFGAAVGCSAAGRQGQGIALRQARHCRQRSFPIA